MVQEIRLKKKNNSNTKYTYHYLNFIKHIEILKNYLPLQAISIFFLDVPSSFP